MSIPPFITLPAGVRAVRLPTSRGELAALDAAAAGPVRGCALLVPGFTGSKEDFIAVLAPLAADGWHTVAIDLPGQHESPHASSPEDYDVAALAQDVLAVTDAVAGPDRPVHLLGHSFGGLVVRSFALAAARRVASLSLLCSGPAGLAGAEAQQLRRFIDALGTVDLATIWAIMCQLDAENGVPAPPADVAAFLEHRFLGNDPVGLRRIAEQLLDEPDRVDQLLTALDGRGTPVLVAHGEGDTRWPIDEQKDMAVRLGARYVIVAGAAHSPAAEKASETARLLSGFWGSCAVR